MPRLTRFPDAAVITEQPTISDSIAVNERRLRFQSALAECARTLLASTGERRLEEAVEALLAATQATYVFLERNVIDSDLGFCSQTVASASDDPRDPALSHGYWDLVPWSRMPVSRAHMERGEPFLIIPEELEGVEADWYADDPNPAASELNIPIFVNGEWGGLVGFSNDDVVGEWTEEDLSLLTAAATMFGAFWEREAAREEMERLVRSKDQFLASISHELRTPLTALVGFAQILRDDPHTLSTEEHTECLTTIVDHSMDITNIVSDLLIAATADVDALRVACVSVNLDAQAAQVIEGLNPVQQARIELSSCQITAAADPERVRQILRNLISNSLRYGGDTIWVSSVEEGPTVRLLVSDSGPAIPESDREIIFEAYHRAHSAPGVANSLGLGLAISRQLAQRMGGGLGYRHHDGRSIFELTLPAWS